MSDPVEFRQDLQALINRHSMESGSDTPDFILAEYLADCLATFDKAASRRERWWGQRSSALRAARAQPKSGEPAG